MNNIYAYIYNGHLISCMREDFIDLYAERLKKFAKTQKNFM